MSEVKILHSQIEGNGEDLLILHGLFGMLDNWKTLGKKWAETHKVHLIDQRNHGRSFHHNDCSYPAMAEDLLRYMDHHNISSANILGHSMGGKTAMFFACNHPDRVKELIIADIGPQEYAPHHDEIIAGLKAVEPENKTSRTDADEAMKPHIPQPGVRQFLLKNLYWMTDQKLAWRFNLKDLASNISEVVKSLPDSLNYLGRTLFIRGGSSGYISDKDFENLKSQFPKAQLKTIENAGHWLHAEQPKLFKEIIDTQLT